MSHRRRNPRTFRPIQFNILPDQTHIRGTEWSKRRTQPTCELLYHSQYEQAQEFNYHISMFFRGVLGVYNGEIDHHATLWDSRGSRTRKYHYGWCRNSFDEPIWRDTLNRNNPDHLRVIELFNRFEREKSQLYRYSTISRMKPPRA